VGPDPSSPTTSKPSSIDPTSPKPFLSDRPYEAPQSGANDTSGSGRSSPVERISDEERDLSRALRILNDAKRGAAARGETYTREQQQEMLVYAMGVVRQARADNVPYTQLFSATNVASESNPASSSNITSGSSGSNVASASNVASESNPASSSNVGSGSNPSLPRNPLLPYLPRNPLSASYPTLSQNTYTASNNPSVYYPYQHNSAGPSNPTLSQNTYTASNNPSVYYPYQHNSAGPSNPTLSQNTYTASNNPSVYYPYQHNSAGPSNPSLSQNTYTASNNPSGYYPYQHNNAGPSNPSMASNIGSASHPSENSDGAINTVGGLSELVREKYSVGQPPANDPSITPETRAQDLKSYLIYLVDYRVSEYGEKSENVRLSQADLNSDNKDLLREVIRNNPDNAAYRGLGRNSIEFNNWSCVRVNARLRALLDQVKD